MLSSGQGKSVPKIVKSSFGSILDWRELSLECSRVDSKWNVTVQYVATVVPPTEYLSKTLSQISLLVIPATLSITL